MIADYITLKSEPNLWAGVGQAVSDLDRGQDQTGVTGAFLPQIGLSINSVLVLSRGRDADELDATAATLSALPHVVGIDRIRLSPVQERDLFALCSDHAMYTNRWFHVRSEGADAFETDTLTAWDAFEGKTDSTVVGLWKAAPKDGVTSYLLIARYDDLAAWSRSRPWNQPKDQQDQAWVEQFTRRRAHLVDSSVIATRCIRGPGDSIAD